MTEPFTASNGIEVSQVPTSIGLRMTVTDRDPTQTIPGAKKRSIESWLDPRQVDGLREFFRDEEDRRLGRWRYHQDTDFVAYPTNHPRGVRVLRESTAQAFNYTPDEVALSSLSAWADVAKAYFDAHPEPKPWHDAQEGDIWALNVHGYVGAWRVLDGQFEDPDSTLPLDAPSITAGRRIWPEVS